MTAGYQRSKQWFILLGETNHRRSGGQGVGLGWGLGVWVWGGGEGGESYRPGRHKAHPYSGISDAGTNPNHPPPLLNHVSHCQKIFKNFNNFPINFNKNLIRLYVNGCIHN